MIIPQLKPFYRPAYAQLVPMYTAPDRHYHSMTHIQRLLAIFPGCRPNGMPWSSTAFHFIHDLIWFHDAYYDVSTPGFNEEMSLEIAKRLLVDTGDDGYDRFWNSRTGDAFECAIRLTARHTEDLNIKREVYKATCVAGPDRQLDELVEVIEAFLDADLDAFSLTDHVVKRTVDTSLVAEAQLVPRTAFWEGRIAFFTKLLDRKKIYYTAMYNGCDEIARDRLRALITDAEDELSLLR